MIPITDARWLNAGRGDHVLEARVPRWAVEQGEVPVPQRKPHPNEMRVNVRLAIVLKRPNGWHWYVGRCGEAAAPALGECRSLSEAFEAAEKVLRRRLALASLEVRKV